MNTKLLMTASAILMGIVAILLLFMPQETTAFLGWKNSNITLFQLLGALYFGFAMINWNLRSSLLGGIYGRSVTIGNLSHCLIATLVLIKSVSNQSGETPLIVASIIYAIFTLLFGYMLFTSPSIKSSNNRTASGKKT